METEKQLKTPINNQKNSKNFWNTYKGYIISNIILLTLLTLLIVLVCTNANIVQILDNFAFNVVKIFRNPVCSNIFLLITYLGETITIIIFLVISLMILKKKSFPLIISCALSAGINFVIKNIIQRARPVGQFVTNLIFNYPFPDSFSFPSGHSQTSLVFYFILSYILVNNFYAGKHKKLFLGLTLIIPCLIMLSRIVLGVHFFTDVLCGATLGSLIITNFLLFKKVCKNST